MARTIVWAQSVNVVGIPFIYRPNLPAPGTPGVDFVVGRTSNNYLSIAYSDVSGTSTTSLNPSGAIGTQVTFTTQSGVTRWNTGQQLYIPSNSNSSIYFYGTVVSYSSTTLVITITNIGSTTGVKTDWNIWNLPEQWQWSATFARVNSSPTDWDFSNITGYFQVQMSACIFSQCIFDLANTLINNHSFVVTLGGRYYSVINCTFNGRSTTVDVPVCLDGACILAAYNLIIDWPNDWADITPLAVRPNNTVVGLNYGISTTSSPHLDFICTTGGTTAGSEPAAYTGAVNGQTITDGTAVFTAQNTKHYIRFNKVRIACSVVGLHPDGMQLAATVSTGRWDSGADLEIYNNDIQPTITSISDFQNINIAGGGSYWAVDIYVHDNILIQGTNAFSMFWGGNGAIVNGGSAEYINNYYRSDSLGPLYNGQFIKPNLTMSGCRDYLNGNTLTFSVALEISTDTKIPATGTQTFNIIPGIIVGSISFNVGSPIVIFSSSASSTKYTGTITSYDSGTGILTINASSAAGGSQSDWTVAFTVSKYP